MEIRINHVRENSLKIYTRYRKQANTIWGDDDHFYSSNRYLLENLKSLKICRECFQLYGAVRLEDGRRVKQKCRCTYKPDEKNWSTTLNGQTYRHDYNKEYEICYCCGLEVIPSGSRWSSFYCRDCKKSIRALNQKIRKCIIPIGRHSLMNGISLSGREIKNEDAIGYFVDASKQMFSRIHAVQQNQEKILKKRVQLLSLSDDATALDLLLKTTTTGRKQLKKEAFLELVAFTLNTPLDETRHMLNELMGRQFC